MSQSYSIDELLDLPEDLDYEIGDDEEEALLDDRYDETNTTTNSKEDLENNDEEDILDLDYSTELNDKDSTLEQEETNRQDRFTSERPVQQCDEPVAKKTFINKPQKRPGNQSFRGRRPQRLSRPNLQSRQPNKRVLINPHFKGNVPIRNNVSLVWDKNYGNVKKPAVHVQPWAHQTTPVFQTQTVYENPYRSQTQQIPQRLGKIFAQPILNHQETIGNQQFQTHPLYPAQGFAATQQYQNYAFLNQYQHQQQHALNIFGTPPPPILNRAYGNSAMFDAQLPAYSVPRYEAPARLRRMSAETCGDDGRGANFVNMGPQARRKLHQQGAREGRSRRAVPSNLQVVRTSDSVVVEQMYGHISGGHFNPCVTVAALIMGKMDWILAPFYVFAQIGGGLVGYGILYLLTPESMNKGCCVTVLHPDIELYQVYWAGPFAGSIIMAVSYRFNYVQGLAHLGSSRSKDLVS